MERRFGRDLWQVCIHADRGTQRSAGTIGARAYTFVDRINAVTVATINLSICGRAAGHSLESLAAYEIDGAKYKCQLQAQM
ncbi:MULTISPECIES: eCIS core domain-containing protein [Paraburkholderia]|uniref:eCIS core domain-containing protein n=1 Tax=Paraburkholderia TaxID=1822464 RepID=UPI0038BB3006